MKSGLATIRKRADFLAANGGLRTTTPGFILLVRDRKDADASMRVGFTVTKKIGNAVVRNRMKRRFRELLRAALPSAGLADHDHVLIGRDGVFFAHGLCRDCILRAVTIRTLVLAVCATVGASSSWADEVSMRGDALHRMTLLRAAPGRLLELFLPVPFHAFFGIALMMTGSVIDFDQSVLGCYESPPHPSERA